MTTPADKPPLCETCGAAMELRARDKRSLIDIIGASVLGVLVVCLAALFVFLFGFAGGRYNFTIVIGGTAFALWTLWFLVGAGSPRWACPNCSQSRT